MQYRFQPPDGLARCPAVSLPYILQHLCGAGELRTGPLRQQHAVRELRATAQRRQAILHRQRVERRQRCAAAALATHVFLILLAAVLCGSTPSKTVIVPCHANNIMPRPSGCKAQPIGWGGGAASFKFQVSSFKYFNERSGRAERKVKKSQLATLVKENQDR